MGSILKVDTSSPDMFERPNFPVLEPGRYTFEVANDLKVQPSKSSNNQIVKIELRCVDDDHKGVVIYDNLVIGADAKTRKSCEWKINQFAASCGVIDPSNPSAEIDLEEFQGKVCEALVAQEIGKTASGRAVTRNVIEEYLYHKD